MDKEIVCACYCRIGHDIEEKEKSRKNLTKKDISRLVREVPADFFETGYDWANSTWVYPSE